MNEYLSLLGAGEAPNAVGGGGRRSGCLFNRRAHVALPSTSLHCRAAYFPAQGTVRVARRRTAYGRCRHQRGASSARRSWKDGRGRSSAPMVDVSRMPAMMTSTPRSTYWRARRPWLERLGDPPPRRASTASRPMRYVWDTDHASTASRAVKPSLREELDPGRVALGPRPEVGSLHRPRSEPGIALVGLPLGQKEPSQARLPAIVRQLDGSPLLADCLVDHADELVLARDVRVRRHRRHAELVGHGPHAEASQPVASDETTSGLHDLIESERRSAAPPRRLRTSCPPHESRAAAPGPLDLWCRTMYGPRAGPAGAPRRP